LGTPALGGPLLSLASLAPRRSWGGKSSRGITFPHAFIIEMIYYGQKLCITICYRQKLCAQVLIESYAFKLLAKGIGIGYGEKSTCNVSIKKLICQSSRWPT
jgi:hypothetical protein